MAVTKIDVAVPDAPYTVTVGSGLLARLPEFIPIPRHARQAVVVSSGVPAEGYAQTVAAALSGVGLQAGVVRLPVGEPAKTMSTLEQLLHEFAQARVGRDDFVVAVGGGVVCDVAGFAASVWNRGIPVVHVPTTLLAQVDASVGGKTGVNLAEGKNLVGTFHQPLAVVVDIETLATLPERERRAGLGEVAKYGFITDPTVLDLLAQHPDEAAACEPSLAEELVCRSLAVKARVVAADERESGERMFLNYGHTVGHAIEAIGGYETFLHGEAVSLGMVFAARLGERLGLSEPGLAARTVDLMSLLKLPVGGIELDTAHVWEHMRLDKKARQGIRFVLCRRPGSAFLADPPEPALVDEVLMTLRS